MGLLNTLPKWAQENFKDLLRERDVAVRELNEYCDSQTPSAFYCDELVCTETPPVTKRRYFQGQRITVNHAGVELDIYIGRGDFIELRWHEKHGVADVALVPDTHCGAKLVTKENMR